MPMPFDPELIAGIKGFLEPDEAERLYLLGLNGSRLGPCLEIGGYCGKSTLCLGAASREYGTVLFSIDHHRGHIFRADDSHGSSRRFRRVRRFCGSVHLQVS